MITDLRGLTLEDLSHVWLSDIGDRLMDQPEIEHLFHCNDALWQYPGEPRADVPHAITRAEEHTDMFINCMAVLEQVNLCEILAMQQVLRLEALHFEEIHKIGMVVDAAYSGTDYGKDIARLLGLRQGFAPAHRTVEKDVNGNPTKWRGIVREGQSVLVANELMTTPDGSTYMAKMAVDGSGAVRADGRKTFVRFFPFAALLVNRAYSDDTLVDGMGVAAVLRYRSRTIKVKKGEVCPYCEAGSVAMKPKEGTNWQNYFSGR